MQNMPDDYVGQGGDGQKFRKRARGCLSGKKGKTAGLAAFVAPLVGLVVNDLRKPDSLIRSLARKTVQKLLGVGTKGKEAIDITDKVEVVRGRDEIDPRSWLPSGGGQVVPRRMARKSVNKGGFQRVCPIGYPSGAELSRGDSGIYQDRHATIPRAGKSFGAERR